MSKPLSVLILASLMSFSVGVIGCGDTDGQSNQEEETENSNQAPGQPSGDLELDEGPLSVVPNETESDKILVFRERAGYSLPDALTVEATDAGVYEATGDLTESTLDEGTNVDSFYVHFDHPGGGRVEKTGSITFDEPILGVIATSSGMEASNEVVDVASLSTEYPTSSGSLFGFELDSEPDVFELADDGRTLDIDVSTGSKCDSIRVIVEPDS